MRDSEHEGAGGPVCEGPGRRVRLEGRIMRGGEQEPRRARRCYLQVEEAGGEKQVIKSRW